MKIPPDLHEQAMAAVTAILAHSPDALAEAAQCRLAVLNKSPMAVERLERLAEHAAAELPRQVRQQVGETLAALRAADASTPGATGRGNEARLALYLRGDEQEALENHCRRTGRSKAEVVREGLSRVVEGWPANG